MISKYISVDRFGSAEIFFIHIISRNLRSHPIAMYQMLREINDHEDRKTKSDKSKEPTFVIEQI